MDLREVKRLIREIVGASPNAPIPAIVTNVDQFTCSVKIGSLEIEDVKLKPQIGDDSNYMILRPEIGSPVTLLSVDGTLNSLQVIQVNSVKEFEYHHKGLLIKYDGGDQKIVVRNDQYGLYELFDELFQALDNFIVMTSDGPSTGLGPNTIAQLNMLKVKYKQLLKVN